MSDRKQPDPEKLEVLRRLPTEIMQAMTREEIDAFLGDEPWPNSLKEKLKDYLT